MSTIFNDHNEYQPEDDQQNSTGKVSGKIRLVNSKKKQDHTPGPIVTLILVVAVLWSSSILLHQQYDSGYANGSRDGAAAGYGAGQRAGITTGYHDGLGQGQLQAITDLQLWEYSHACTVTSGYVALKIVRDEKGQVTYACGGGK
jgi:hypothetical protein